MTAIIRTPTALGSRANTCCSAVTISRSEQAPRPAPRLWFSRDCASLGEPLPTTITRSRFVRRESAVGQLQAAPERQVLRRSDRGAAHCPPYGKG